MKIAIFCSIFLLPFPQFVHAASKTVCFGYSARLNVDAWHNGQMKYHHFHTRQDNQNGGKQCVAINARMWSKMNAMYPIYFLDPDQQNAEVGRATIAELTDFVNHDGVLMMKKKIYFSWNQHPLTISAYQSGGHIFTQQTEFDHLTNKSYLEFYPDQWNRLQNNADNALVTFNINLEEFIGEVTIGELRKTTAISLMVKKRVYFTYNLGQQYNINVWNEHGQQFLFNADVLLDHSNNKQYLDIDPDQFGHLQGNAWINFSLAGQPEFFSLGRAAVEVLRAVHSEIDFCGNDKNFGPTSSW